MERLPWLLPLLLLLLQLKHSCAANLTFFWTISETRLNLDGASRLCYTINGTIPGPPVIVNQYDVLTFVITNLLATPVSIHWHGLQLQNYPYADGTYAVTECGVLPQTTSVRTFAANNAGTFWYHSHKAMQRLDGLFGAFVVKRANDPQLYNYAEEKIIMMGEWYHRDGDTIMNEIDNLDWIADFFPARQSAFICNETACQGCAENCSQCYSSAIMDCECLERAMDFYPNCTGKSTVNCRDTLIADASRNGSTHSFLNNRCPAYNRRGQVGNFPTTTLACNQGPGWLQINVAPNTRYRLRLISVASGSTMNFAVDNHTLTVVEVDGGNQVVPTNTSKPFPVYVAQRYDVILDTNQPPDNYWIRATGFRCLQAYAVLHYTTAPTSWNLTNTAAPFVNLDFLVKEPWDEDLVNFQPNFTMLQPPQPLPTPDVVLDLYFGCCENLSASDVMLANYQSQLVESINQGCNKNNLVVQKATCWVAFTDTATHEKFMLVQNQTSPILSTAWQYVNKSQSHNTVFWLDASQKWAMPSISVKTNETVRMVLRNYGAHSSHPWHLHGHDVYVLQIGDKYSLANYTNATAYGNYFPGIVQRDTFQISVYGYAIIQFTGGNSGVWAFHCHIDFHHHMGMMLVVNEALENLPPPPENYILDCGFNLNDMDTSPSTSHVPLETILLASLITGVAFLICLALFVAWWWRRRNKVRGINV